MYIEYTQPGGSFSNREGFMTNALGTGSIYMHSSVHGLQDYLLSYGGKETRGTNEHNDFVADFERANFQEGRKLVQKSSFEELQKASLDLEKRLHERIIKSAEAKFEDADGRVDPRQRQSAATSSSRLNRWILLDCLFTRSDRDALGERRGLAFHFTNRINHSNALDQRGESPSTLCAPPVFTSLAR